MKNSSKKYNLYKTVEEFLIMKHGEIIKNPKQKVFVSRKVFFTRKSLKHFIESRIRAGNSRKEIMILLEKLDHVIRNPHIKIKNPNKRKYPDSDLLGSYFPEIKKSVIIILERETVGSNIITLHFKKKSDFEKLKKK